MKLSYFASDFLFVAVKMMDKPIDKEMIIKAVDETGKIVTVGDHNVIGGVGSALAEVVAEYGKGVAFRRLGSNDFSKGYGTYEKVKQSNRVGKSNIYNCLKEIVCI